MLEHARLRVGYEIGAILTEVRLCRGLQVGASLSSGPYGAGFGRLRSGLPWHVPVSLGTDLHATSDEKL